MVIFHNHVKLLEGGVPLNFFGFGVVPLFGMIGFLIIRLSLVCSDCLV